MLYTVKREGSNEYLLIFEKKNAENTEVVRDFFFDVFFAMYRLFQWTFDIGKLGPFREMNFWESADLRTAAAAAFSKLSKSSINHYCKSLTLIWLTRLKNCFQVFSGMTYLLLHTFFLLTQLYKNVVFAAIGRMLDWRTLNRRTLIFWLILPTLFYPF